MVLFFVLSLFSPISISCFWWDLRVKDLSTSCVLAIAFCCIGLLSPRGFVEVKVRELVTLGSLGPRRLLWRLRPFVATWELSILLWVVPQDCCKGLYFSPKGKSIVEGEPSFWARFIGE